MNEATLDSFDLHTTVATRNRYQRIAPFYDLMEGMMERRYRPWRKRLWSMARGPKVLEAGVGAGRTTVSKRQSANNRFNRLPQPPHSRN